ncbi:putative bifunctional diguanylate cyclase/phosphodiesterase [Deinococcus aquiradiocola]|uniref:Uncharacterized protein n=1 Tax=Deinococcus aquiradiocola TaxID=393059 RepID=A0A917PLL4_9DEIO|nr:bifunctional diguanylate cyclase/phosphodiesterase [Deinococcus aquiradiocola]GGJ83455.1 hypothetical protein GCM10008939_29150 [Deinococcus aquiradiocola]
MHSSLTPVPSALSVLSRLARDVAEHAQTREALQAVTQAALDLTSGRAAALLPLSPDGEPCAGVLAGDVGVAEALLPADRAAFQAGPGERAVLERQRVLQDEGEAGWLVALPLAAGQGALGTLTVRRAEPFGPEDLAALEVVAGLAAGLLAREQLERDCAAMTLTDALTGLPRGPLLRDRLEQALARTARDRSPCALLSIDLDHFGRVNEEYGRALGDRALATAAARLRASVRATDTVARTEGDRFVVLLGGLHGVQQALLVAEKVRLVLSVPMNLPGASVTLGASIGVSLAPPHGQQPEELCALAKQAARQAKRHGRGLVWLAQLPGSGSPERRAALTQDLQGALERGEIGVHYQEQFGPDGEPCGVEALARWTSPRWGSVTPTEFIPLCEDDDLIVPLGTWVLREAVTQLAHWRAAGLPYARVAVNVSPVQFLRPDFERVVRAALDDSGLPPACLELELGEAFVASHQSVITQRLHALRGLGVRVVLDDFGTGGSGLAALMQVPLDGLKIDRQFLREDTSAPLREGRGVTASIAMAHALGLDVVLEGVETSAHLALARRAGCGRTQGFLQGRPRPAEEIGAHPGVSR